MSRCTTPRLRRLLQGAAVLALLVASAPARAQLNFSRVDIDFELTPWPTSVGAGDLNHDGLIDLVVSGRSAQNAPAILMANSAGGFDAPVHLDFARHTDWVVVDHLDGDAHLDLALAIRGGPSRVAVLKGMGDGSFAVPIEYAVGREPTHLIAADFDADGDQDLAVSAYNSNAVIILMNDGSGSFNTAQTLSLEQVLRGTATAFYLAVADLDGDQDLDIAAALSAGYIAVIRNRGDGTFYTPVFYPVGTPTGIAAGDIDGDNDVDLLYADLDWFNANSGLAVLENQGAGQFQGITKFVLGDWVWYLTLADLDGDDRLDVIMTDGLGGTVNILRNESTGDISFSMSLLLELGGFPRSASVLDMDGDCDLDLLVANIQAQRVHILENHTPQPPCPEGGSGIGFDLQGIAGQSRLPSAARIRPAVTDRNGDGRIDARDLARVLAEWR